MEKFTFNISGGNLEKKNVRESVLIEDNTNAWDEDEDRAPGIVERQRRSRRRNTILGTVALVLVLILGFFLVVMMRHYNSYDVVSTEKVKGASAYKYVTFDGCLLKYGNDGAILTDPTGKVVWNEGFEMTAPRIDICKDYLILYDRNGSKIFLMDTRGEVAEISTRLPISKAEVSESGTMAVVMKKDMKARIEMYNKKGEVLASGELHIDNSGYPADIALSSNGKLLMVSSVGYEKGDVVSRITFYNFGKAGRNSIDNKVASFDYKGTIVPEVDITEAGKPLAIGSDKIIIYSGKATPEEKTIIKPEGEMKSVFHNDKYIGYVVGEADEKGTLSDTVKLYSYRGFKRYSKKLDFEYRDIKLLDDNEVYVTDGHKIMFISLFGMNRFYMNDEDEIFDVINKKSGREFYFIKSDSVNHVKLTNR